MSKLLCVCVRVCTLVASKIPCITYPLAPILHWSIYFILFVLWSSATKSNHFRFASKNTNPDKCFIIFNFSSRSLRRLRLAITHYHPNAILLILCISVCVCVCVCTSRYIGCNRVWFLLVYQQRIYPRALTTNPKQQNKSHWASKIEEHKNTHVRKESKKTQHIHKETDRHNIHISKWWWWFWLWIFLWKS